MDAKTQAIDALRQAMIVLVHPSVANRALPVGPDSTLYTNKVAVAVHDALQRLQSEVFV